MANITCENCATLYNTNQPFCPNCAQANKFYESPKATSTPVASPSPTYSNASMTPSHPPTPSSAEGDTFLYAVIGFLFWFVGIILFFALVNSRPKAAQSALNGAITAIVVAVVLIFLASL